MTITGVRAKIWNRYTSPERGKPQSQLTLSKMTIKTTNINELCLGTKQETVYVVEKKLRMGYCERQTELAN
jgi:hypothetical protein